MQILSFLTLSILVINLAAPGAKAAVLVTDFGTGQYSSTFTDFPTEIQTGTTYQLVGTDFSFSAFGNLPSTVNVAGSTSFLTLTGTFAGTATTVFGIEIFDTLGNSRLYKAPFSAFPQLSLASVNFNFDSENIVSGAFNNLVTTLGFSTTGTGSTVNITMDSLTAAPEPTSTALMLVGLVSFAARRQRQMN